MWGKSHCGDPFDPMNVALIYLVVFALMALSVTAHVLLFIIMLNSLLTVWVAFQQPTVLSPVTVAATIGGPARAAVYVNMHVDGVAAPVGVQVEEVVPV